jgi:hypothetical protein
VGTKDVKVQLAIVTNQGVPVHTVVVPGKKFQDKIVNELRQQWGLHERLEIPVLATPILYKARTLHSESVNVKNVAAFTDNKKHPRYYLIVTSAEFPDTSGINPSTEWKFCPDCGDPWLSHLEGQASLEPDEWDPCPCSECGCMKAVNP